MSIRQLMIIDDRYVIIGSANINDRSMQARIGMRVLLGWLHFCINISSCPLFSHSLPFFQGDRDSELAVVIRDEVKVNKGSLFYAIASSCLRFDAFFFSLIRFPLVVTLLLLQFFVDSEMNGEPFKVSAEDERITVVPPILVPPSLPPPSLNHRRADSATRCACGCGASTWAAVPKLSAIR